METSPPCKQQPKANNSGWNTVALSVPDGPENRPIPPPRKKRLSDKTNQNESILQNSNLDKEEDEEKVFIIGNEKTDYKNDEKHSNEIEEKDSKEKQVTLTIDKLDNKTNDENIKETTTNTETELEIQNKKSEGNILQNVSKVGNRKSDKFFGENLSESLSNETMTENCDVDNKNSDKLFSGNLSKSLSVEKPMVEIGEENNKKLQNNDNQNTEIKQNELEENHKQDKENNSEISKDETDNYQSVRIESVDATEEMMYKINKEKGNLLFALENQLPQKTPEEIDPNAKPVEEEIIVPIRRQTRHICDDDTHIHNILNKTHPNSIPPKKPQRDFSKYRKSLEIPKEEAQQIEFTTSHMAENKSHSDNETTTKTLSTSDEELHSEAETLPIEESPDKKSSPSRPAKSKINHTLDMTSSDLLDNEEIQVTSDLIEAITQQANNLSMSLEGYVPEDYRTSSNDGSSNFSPNSKITDRKHKISLTSIDDQLNSMKIQNQSEVIQNEQTSTEENNNQKLKIDLNSEEKDEYLPNYEEATGIPRTSLNFSAVTEDKNPSIQLQVTSTSAENDELKRPLPIDPNFHRKVSSTKEISDAIKSFLSENDLNSKEILKLLEEEFGDLLNSSCLSEDDREIIQKLKIDASLTNTEPSEKISSIKNAEPSSPLSLNEKHNIEQHKNELSTNNETPIKPSTVKLDDKFDLKSPAIINKALETVMSNEKRRHSIDDLDSWFISDSKENNKNINDNDENNEIKHRKREISLPNALDITTVSICLNEELKSSNKSPDELFKTNELSKKIEKINEQNDNSTKHLKNEIIVTNKNDHSSLLKFLENEKVNYHH